jgi:hypothetical protein
VVIPGWVNVNVYDALVENKSDEKTAGEPVSEAIVYYAERIITNPL